MGLLRTTQLTGHAVKKKNCFIALAIDMLFPRITRKIYSLTIKRTQQARQQCLSGKIELIFIEYILWSSGTQDKVNCQNIVLSDVIGAMEKQHQKGNSFKKADPFFCS